MKATDGDPAEGKLPETELLKAATVLMPRMSMWRRTLHTHPELGFDERASSQLVEEHLKDLGLHPLRLANTGVVAVLDGGIDGPTIALRGDMDALPLQDEGLNDYRSQIPGVAHSCGHDAHTAMLMAVAEILSINVSQIRGKIKFIFQPAEESGLGGAEALIDEGVLNDPDVDAIYALHVAPSQPSGTLTITPGVASAAVDWLDIAIEGGGGHAAHPHEAIDTTLVAAHVTTALQHIVSRRTPPLEPLVVTLGQIEGGVAPGVIAPRVDLRGTVRSLDSDIRIKAKEWIEQLVVGLAQAFGAESKVTFRSGIPALWNSPELVDQALAVGTELVGPERCTIGRASMGGEDFAFYASKVPAVLARLGVSDGTARTSYPLHHPKFDLDESAMPVGAGLLASLALRGVTDVYPRPANDPQVPAGQLSHRFPS